MSNPQIKTLKIAAGVGGLFCALVVVILVLAAKHIVTFPMALLMFVALFGLYVGFGVLIATYRFVGRLK